LSDSFLPPELIRAYQVFKLRLEAAKAMGRSFEQNAEVWVGPEGIADLITFR
jgi:hypothetical protein